MWGLSGDVPLSIGGKLTPAVAWSSDSTSSTALSTTSCSHRRLSRAVRDGPRPGAAAAPPRGRGGVVALAVALVLLVLDQRRLAREQGAVDACGDASRAGRHPGRPAPGQDRDLPLAGPRPGRRPGRALLGESAVRRARTGPSRGGDLRRGPGPTSAPRHRRAPRRRRRLPRRPARRAGAVEADGTRYYGDQPATPSSSGCAAGPSPARPRLGAAPGPSRLGAPPCCPAHLVPPSNRSSVSLPGLADAVLADPTLAAALEVAGRPRGPHPRPDRPGGAAAVRGRAASSSAGRTRPRRHGHLPRGRGPRRRAGRPARPGRGRALPELGDAAPRAAQPAQRHRRPPARRAAPPRPPRRPTPANGPLQGRRRAGALACSSPRSRASATSSRSSSAPATRPAARATSTPAGRRGVHPRRPRREARRVRGARRHRRRLPAHRGAPAARGVLGRRRRGDPHLLRRRPAHPREGRAALGAAVPRAAAHRRGARPRRRARPRPPPAARAHRQDRRRHRRRGHGVPGARRWSTRWSCSST